MADLTFKTESLEGGALRRWDLRGPNGMVRFETADALGFKTASVYLHELVAPKGADLEDCELCGKCWRNALGGNDARSLRAEWEAAGDDDIIREALERWYNEKLSSPVPVSEGSQVSGEVGPASGVVAGSNQIAATGAGNGPGGVVPVPVAADRPDEHWNARIIREAAERNRAALDRLAASPPPPVPVAAQPRYVLDVAGVLGLISQYAEACVEAATTGSPKAKDNALERREEVRHAIRAALTPIPVVEPEPRWGSGPLVDHNPETPAEPKYEPEMDGPCCNVARVTGGKQHEAACIGGPL